MLKESDFLRGIVFEDNPYEEETPAEVTYYDTNGNEVEVDETE